MSCRPAPACKAVLDQANKLWPHRSRASDGICASATHHAQNPTSDHEPDVHGIAHAVDITHDPANGCDNDAIVAMLLACKDPRVKYLIHNRTIWRSYKTNAKQPKAWDPQPYGGPNPHTHHLHISVWTEHENDTSPWFTALAPTRPPLPAPRITTTGDDVRRIDLAIDIDKDGRGYRDLDAKALDVVSVVANTANPPDSGYKPIPDVARLDVAGKARIVVEEAVPSGRIDVSVWVVK